MKKSLSIVAVMVLALFAGSAWASQKVVVYGDNGYPPYSYGEGRDVKGIYVDILKEAFSKMEGYDVEIKVLPWKRLMAELESGKIVAGFPPYKVAARPWMVYSEPILQENVVAFGLKSKVEGKNNWPEDFYSSRVGLNHGFSYENLLGHEGSNAVAEGKLTVEEAMDSPTNLRKLVAGRIDVYVNDQLTDISGFSSEEDPIIIAATVGGQWGYLGFSSNNRAFPYADEFRAAFDEVIKEMKDSGRIDEILKNYMK
ncbi:substrate-binding periplasmic protein [Dethiosulfovibrio salsuginis]|uniref:Amino acid ABC transporter substrate-binding protein, PAAT family n=1 Tax=Dethiosulfovibrio salsuginis TaxID=561720 RepID=A0A1X7JG34_9BACT|nr:transporter substrate-binding domain-containing protein [Dethiosulfovibrio salsuginis]SMG26202.1 amino acid ABC transporter substrate-binding protein, PAAT family [Dethiosulfovibrio salsuginis]